MTRTFLSPMIATALLAAAPVSADEPTVTIERRHFAAADDARLQADAWKRWADDFSYELRSSMGSMFGHRLGSTKVVKGAPYSAEIITESNQNLADGNVISRKTRGAAYRDSMGRTRQETPGDGKSPTVYISDPVEGTEVVLTPGRKRALVTSSKGLEQPRLHGKPNPNANANPNAKVTRNQVIVMNGREFRIEDGRVIVDGKDVTGGKMEYKTKGGKTILIENGTITIDGKELAEVIRDQSADRVVVKTVDATESPDGTRREEVRVQVVRSADGHLHPLPPVPPAPPAPPAPGAMAIPPLAPLPPMPGVQGMRFESVSKLGKGVTTSLGMKDFDGLKAEGKSTVWTIPAGEIGNRNPINVTSESWYSPDLQVTVYSRYNDPRTGESIYRLAGIKRAEPAADLFKVPEDFDVKPRQRGKTR